MASHDDTLVEHVEEALSNGISISEFPTTTEAACCASENGNNSRFLSAFSIFVFKI